MHDGRRINLKPRHRVRCHIRNLRVIQPVDTLQIVRYPTGILKLGDTWAVKWKSWLKLKLPSPKHGGFLYETTKVEADAVVFRGSRCRDVRNSASPGGVAGEGQAGGWYHSPI